MKWNDILNLLFPALKTAIESIKRVHLHRWQKTDHIHVSWTPNGATRNFQLHARICVKCHRKVALFGNKWKTVGLNRQEKRDSKLSELGI